MADQNRVPRRVMYDPAVQEAFTAWQDLARRSRDARRCIYQAEAEADLLHEQAQDVLRGGAA
jgi:hypothetical protein